MKKIGFPLYAPVLLYKCLVEEDIYYKTHQESMSMKCLYLYSITAVYIGLRIFLIVDPKHRLWVLDRTALVKRF